MPRATVRSPDWESYSRRLILRATPSEIHELDVFTAEFGVTRAWLLRRAIAAGLPQVVAELRSAQAVGLQVAGPSGDVGEATRGGGAASPVAVVLVERAGPVARRKRRRVPPREWGLMLAPSVWRPDGPAAPTAARLWRGPAVGVASRRSGRSPRGATVARARWCATGSSGQASGRCVARHRSLRGPEPPGLWRGRCRATCRGRPRLCRRFGDGRAPQRRPLLVRPRVEYLYHGAGAEILQRHVGVQRPLFQALVHRGRHVDEDAPLTISVASRALGGGRLAALCGRRRTRGQTVQRWRLCGLGLPHRGGDVTRCGFGHVRSISRARGSLPPLGLSARTRLRSGLPLRHAGGRSAGAGPPGTPSPRTPGWLLRSPC